MLKKFLTLSILSLSLLFTACSSKQEVENKNMYVNEFQDAPTWLFQTTNKKSLTGVGSAAENEGGDFNFQRDEAAANARDNLAKQIKVTVSNMFKTFKSTTGSGKSGTFDKSVESVSKQIANEVLVGTKVTKMWKSPKGNLFVLVEMDKSNAKKDMNKIIKTSFKNDEAMYQKFLASKAFKEFQEEIDNLKN